MYHSGGSHGDDPLSGRVPERASEPSRSRVDDGSGDGTFHGFLIGYLGFSRKKVFIGERARSVEAAHREGGLRHHMVRARRCPPPTLLWTLWLYRGK